MDKILKQKIKEKLGAFVAVSTLAFSIIGIFSLSEYISIYGSIMILCALFGMYKYV